MVTIEEMDERLGAALADPRRPIDGERLIHTLREVVAEQPDYVYTLPAHMQGGNYVCCYVHTDADTGEPQAAGCVVGAVLDRLGIPLAGIEALEGAGATQAVPVFLNITGPLAAKAVEVLDCAQAYQDGGAPWGVALANAEAVVGTTLL